MPRKKSLKTNTAAPRELPLLYSPVAVSASLSYLLAAVQNYYDESDVGRMVEQLVAQIAAAFPPGKPFNVVGIRTRGEILAQRVVDALAKQGITPAGRGVLDITLYRDDLSEIGPRPLVRPTHLEISIDKLPLLLIDDVIFSGRSVRGALNLLADFGRPSAIRLAVLVDRKGREVPIQPDFVGLTLAAVPPDHRVNVRLRESDGKDEISVQPRT